MNNTTDFKIIVIDDNPAIHRDFLKILTKETNSSALDQASSKLLNKVNTDDFELPNFRIDTASQGQEGVERIKKALLERQPYSLAFVDIRMPPGWDGIETIKHIWELDKDIQIVICTAYSDYTWEETVAHLGKTDNLLILKKPFDNVSVRQLACALTTKWQLFQETQKFTSSLKKQVKERTLSLEESLSLIKATLESSDEGIVAINNEGKIVEYNQRFCEIWHIPPDIVTEKNKEKLATYMKDQLIDAAHFANWLTSVNQKSEETHTNLIHLKNGKILNCYSRPQRINSNIVGRVLNFRDVTEKIKLEKELEFQAQHDSLTGLPNRINLHAKLRDAIKFAEQQQTTFALVFLDLDRFKLINDSLSHAAGDELLRLIAKRLSAMIDKEDTCARLGGDEFVIIFNAQTKDTITKKIEQLMAAFHEPFMIENRAVTMTASIGISLYPADGKTGDLLLRNADSAMYFVKEMGANNYKFYLPEMNAKSLDKLEKEIELRHAIENKELFLCYQPEFDLKNESLIAVEALIRWNHPIKGLLLPMEFIPLAEETGLIGPIGEWTIRTACSQNKAWQDLGFPPIRIAINITSHQLKQPGLVELIKSVLKETKMKAEYLELELTENILISNAQIIRVVQELKNLGISIAIDDFGTGYSSLSYLKRLPLDRLKIDGTLIQNIKEMNDDEAIVRAIISVAKDLHLEVLAEGVETNNQLTFLKKQDCLEIQGFYFSKPLTEPEMETLFKNLKKNKKLILDHKE